MNNIGVYIVKITMIIVIVFILGNCVLYGISEHLNLDYNDISSIDIGNFDDVMLICLSDSEIKEAVEELNKINFYYSKSERIEDSPVSAITIHFKDGSELCVRVLFIDVMIYKVTSTGEMADDANFYLIKPYTVEKIKKRLSR